MALSTTQISDALDWIKQTYGNAFDANGAYTGTSATTNQGVADAAAAKGYSASDLASILGIPTANVSNYLATDYKPSTTTATTTAQPVNTVTQPAGTTASTSTNTTPTGIDSSILSKLQPISNSGWDAGGGSYLDPISGKAYVTTGGQRSGESDPGPIDGYISFDPNHHAIGDPYTMYYPDGSFQGSTKFEDTNSGEWLWQLAFAAAMAGGIGFDSGLFGSGTSSGGGISDLAGNAGYDSEGLVAGNTGGAASGGGLTDLAGNAGYDSEGLVADTGAAAGAGAYTSAAADSQAANALITGAGLGIDNGLGDWVAANGSNPLGGYLAFDPGNTGSLPVSNGGAPVGTGTSTGGGIPSGGGVPSGLGTGLGSGLWGKTGGGLDLSNLLKLIGGGIDLHNQTKASNDMLDWLKAQQAKIDNLYNPGTPEYNALWDQMSRKDAAAGRNSQYGPRSVDLAARIAQIKADETQKLTSGVSASWAAALNQKAAAPTGLSTGLGNLFSGNGGGLTLDSLLKLLSGSGGTIPGTNIPIGTDLSTLNGDNAPGGSNFGSDLGFDDPFGP